MVERDGIGTGDAASMLERFRGIGGEAAGTGRVATGLRLQRRGFLLPALVVILGVVAVVSWRLIAAPAPIEERMPRASPGGSDSQQVVNVAEGSSAPVGTEDQEAGPESGDTPVLVHVAGAVVRPGVVELPADARVNDAVVAAGGLAPGADPDRVNLAAPLLDGSWIVIPAVGDPAMPVQVPTSAPPGGGAGGAAGGSGEPGGANGTLVDLNTADAKALEELPGVGPATAEAILDHRSSAGPFGSVDDLLAVRGIGEAKLEALREHVTVSGSPSG